jgi:hypothetical protein
MARSAEKKPKKFKSKHISHHTNLAPPRVVVIGEGQMEQAALTDLVISIKNWKDLPVQIVRSGRRIRAGGFVTPQTIAKTFLALARLHMEEGDCEGVCGLIDHEHRSESWDVFGGACRSELDKKCKDEEKFILCIASKSIEAWLLADVDGMRQGVRPNQSSALHQNKYPNVESVSHPAEREIKKYWPNYDKVRDGAAFLKSVRPSVMVNYSSSFRNFVDRLVELSKSLS